MSNADTIIHTLPQTAAEQAVIRRVHLLTDLAWTPLRDIPAFVKGQGYTILPAGVPVTGLPYSSTEATDKFITENVSLYTFLSTIPIRTANCIKWATVRWDGATTVWCATVLCDLHSASPIA